MKSVNVGICNTCQGRAPSEFVIREGQVWIRKNCPQCGPTESLVSTDAEAWKRKQDLHEYISKEHGPCSMNCDRCHIDHNPNMVFLDVTNRCNMNCPICIATIRDMGFDFNPPLSYFDKIFAELGKMNPRPVVQLFGGEPTVRNDLVELIRMADKYGLKPHVVTNGLRLADEDYCRKLCESRVALRFGFDGRNADIYEKLRHNRPAYDKKMKALDNLRRFSRRKHAIISCAGWGFNDRYIPDLLQYCHDNRDLISDIGIIPLTENWHEGSFSVSVHTTMEDVEKMVQQSVPGGEVEFIPAGLTYAMKKARTFFRSNPRSEILLLAGVHPNCESMTLLVSDGKTFRSIGHYMKKPFSEAAVDFANRMKRIEPRLDALDPKKFFQRLRGRWLIVRTVLPWIFGTLRLGRLIGNPITAIGRLLGKFVTKKVFRRRYAKDGTPLRRPRRIMRVAMLPFEEQHSIDAERLQNCKAVFAYEDTSDGSIRYFPACNWYGYRNPLLEKISQKYGIAGKETKEQIEAALRA